jgi:hypothetical protein
MANKANKQAKEKGNISLQSLGARQNLGTDLSYTKVGRLM